jgi:glycogen operon protein
MSRPLAVTPGRPWRLGAHPRDGGFDFAIFSRGATRMWLDLFLDPDARSPSHEIELSPDRHRTGDVWHAHVAGIGAGVGYAFRADGPWAPAQGQRFDAAKRLYDPYAYALRTRWWGRPPHRASGDRPRWTDGVCLTVDVERTRSGDDAVERPRRSWSETIVYETHVRGLSMHPSAASPHPGTFLGLVAKIPYLRELGVTAVELLPIHEFNPREIERHRPDGTRLRNYWGYSTVGFFAPAEGYGTGRAPGCQVEEFASMVRSLHRAGIEVILDVVFNHTAESHERGPTLSFRRLGNDVYYLLERDRRRYRDLTGCGNTVACQHPIVQDLIVDCLRHWADLGVDGFRFDLAAVLARGAAGELLDRAPLLERISEDPLLRGIKLIAEPWDAADGHRLGAFPPRWAEWNDRYRDDVRRFWRGDPGFAGALATRLCGSADVYQATGGTPARSVNFVTCHDGFTLADLVSHSRKHNVANGERGRDGAGENFSAHHGTEGATDDPVITAVRLRQQKNLIATLLLSRGVPMLLGGDELGRTQLGNNNAYCQDNEISWYDWTLLERNRELFRFVREMIAFRRRHPVLRRDEFYEPGEIHWLSRLGEPRNWSVATSVLAAHLRGRRPGDGELCLVFNASTEGVTFRIPPPHDRAHWHVAVDTGAASPDDVAAPGAERPLPDDSRCPVRDRSLVVLEARRL